MTGLCVVTALPSEARPWIDHYRLSPVQGSPLRLYRGNGVALVVSGIGASACTAATGFLAGVIGSSGPCVWLNVGIAGHADFPRGEAVVVAKSDDAAGRGAYYPSLPVRTALPRAECITVDKVETDYATKALYDMECSGFFAAASRFAILDLVHSVKVVSDNPGQGVEDLDRHMVTSLIAARLRSILDGLVDPLLALARELHEETAAVDLSPFTTRWHFSVANQHRLRRLASDWRAVHGGASPDAARFWDCESASEVMARMRRDIDAAPHSW